MNVCIVNDGNFTVDLVSASTFVKNSGDSLPHNLACVMVSFLIISVKLQLPRLSFSLPLYLIYFDLFVILSDCFLRQKF
jgi:hypothetical protein